jgi:hypothetical protein
MAAALLLQWHYLVFLLPLGVAILLLVLSTLRFGAHRGGGNSGHHGAGLRHGVGGHHQGHGVGRHAGGQAKAAHGRAHHPRSANGKDGDRGEGVSALGLLLTLIGVGRAPLPIVLQMFFLCWGVAGILANQILLPNVSNPTFAQVLPSLGTAFWLGLIGSRIGAELFGQVMPQEESSVVSRDSLFGMTGRVVFPVTETGGRVHIYDENNTLHDEPCRVPSGQAAIAKGRPVLVADRDEKGVLVVEELP